jgi:hypothetical protein
MSLIKEKMINIIREQPEDSNFFEILQELSFINMIENGLNDSKNNKITSEKMLKEEIKKW